MNLKLAVVSISVGLAAILVYLISANKWTDDRLEFPLCYTHGILPLRRLLPKLVSLILCRNLRCASTPSTSE